MSCDPTNDADLRSSYPRPRFCIGHHARHAGAIGVLLSEGEGCKQKEYEGVRAGLQLFRSFSKE